MEKETVPHSTTMNGHNATYQVFRIRRISTKQKRNRRLHVMATTNDVQTQQKKKRTRKTTGHRDD